MVAMSPRAAGPVRAAAGPERAHVGQRRLGQRQEVLQAQPDRLGDRLRRDPSARRGGSPRPPPRRGRRRGSRRGRARRARPGSRRAARRAGRRPARRWRRPAGARRPRASGSGTRGCSDAARGCGARTSRPREPATWATTRPGEGASAAATSAIASSGTAEQDEVGAVGRREVVVVDQGDRVAGPASGRGRTRRRRARRPTITTRINSFRSGPAGAVRLVPTTPVYRARRTRPADCASRSPTRSGASSARGARTNARSYMRGWGRVSPGSSLSTPSHQQHVDVEGPRPPARGAHARPRGLGGPRARQQPPRAERRCRPRRRGSRSPPGRRRRPARSRRPGDTRWGSPAVTMATPAARCAPRSPRFEPSER